MLLREPGEIVPRRRKQHSLVKSVGLAPPRRLAIRAQVDCDGPVLEESLLMKAEREDKERKARYQERQDSEARKAAERSREDSAGSESDTDAPQEDNEE